MNPVPHRAERLVRWSLAPWERAAVLGDLQEEARAIAARTRPRAARQWYWRQAAVSVWPNLVRRFKGDEERRQAFYSSIVNLVFIAFAFGIALSDRRPSVPPALYAIGLATALMSTCVPFFGRRLRPPKFGPGLRQTTLRAAGALMIAAFVVALIAHSNAGLVLVAVIARVLPALNTPRDSVQPDEYVVAGASLNDPDRDRYLRWHIPNEPAGLGDLVLCRATEAFDPGVPPADAAMIQRRFSSGVTVRVCSAINLTPTATSVRLDVIDASNHVVSSRPAEIRHGSLTEMPETWDDLADRDAATHFGAIDEAVSFHGVVPGRYTLRLTATAGDRTAIRQDEIQITG